MADQRAEPERRQRSRHHVPGQDAGPVRQVPGQIGAEPDVRRPGQIVGSFGRQPGLAEHPAAGAVGAHHVLGPHGQRRICVTLPDDAGDPILALREAGELPPEPDVSARVPCRPQEHRFQHGLRAVRHRLRTRHPVVGDPLGAGPPRFRSHDLQAGQSSDPQVVGHQVLRRGDRVEPVADPQVPEDLDGALVDDVGARRVGGSPVPLDDQMAYPVPRQRDRQGQPGGAGPDDQDGHLDSLCTWNRHRPPPPRGITRRVVPRFSGQLTR